jgi:membrane protein
MNLVDAVQGVWRVRLPRSLQILQRWPWLDTARTLRIRFREDRLGLTASSLTYTTLVSIVPLLTVMLAVFSVFPMFAAFQEALQRYFLQSLVPDHIAHQVLAALTQFSAKAKGVGGLGVLLLLGTALAMMLTIDRTLNHIWRVRKSRPIAQRVLVYWAAATLGPLVLGISLSLTSYAVSASRGFVGALPGGIGVVLGGIDFVLLAAGLAGLFHYVPNTAVRWRDALTGGVSAALALQLAKRALGAYLAAVPTYSMVYGAFATLPILLVWIYLGWVIVLLGAVIAAYAPSLRMRVKRWPDRPGAQLELALAVLRELCAGRASGRVGCTSAALADALRADPLQVEPVLDALASFDWVGRLQEGEEPRWVMLCDPALTRARPLLERLLLAPTPGSAALWQRAGFDAVLLRDLMQD